MRAGYSSPALAGSSAKNPLLIAVSTVAVAAPLIALIFAGDHFRSWPELPKHATTTSPAPPTNQPRSPKSGPLRTATPPPSQQPADEPAQPSPVELDTFAKAIEPFWPAQDTHGSVKEFLADGTVRAIFVQGKDIASPPADLWARACDEPSARCVLILPATSLRPDSAQNLVVVAVDDQTSTTMQSANSVFVYDKHGRCVHAARYRDVANVPLLLHALLPAVALASAPTLLPIPASSRTSRGTGGTTPTHPRSERSEITLATLDAPVAPLFSAGRTTLLRTDPIREARAHSKRVVLCFWATYCKPCVAELGELARLRTEHSNVAFVGLLDDSDSDDIRAMARKMIPESFSNHYFLSDHLLQSRIFKTVSMPLPAFAVFDANGNLLDAFVGSLLADPHNHQRLMDQLHKPEQR
jgi:thiol-disulfide isomerase/thioredoxin